jgi:predicted RNA-binding Zn-ribbon protein involved in translation (DUF1610 family)
MNPTHIYTNHAGECSHCGQSAIGYCESCDWLLCKEHMVCPDCGEEADNVEDINEPKKKRKRGNK